jgi:hypothetical protein
MADDESRKRVLQDDIGEALNKKRGKFTFVGSLHEALPRG